MTTNKWIASSQYLYRWLLQLYPRTYRANYEMEMFHVFTDQCREAYRQQGRLGILGLWLRTLSDVGTSLLREHLSDPHAGVGLLEGRPNAPLPWKGVLLVLIPGLIFFVSQIEQITSNNDWFFLAFYRAGYILIVPVLLVWLLTRRFPVWGLIPVGLLYATLLNYSQRLYLSNIPLIGHFFERESVMFLGSEIDVYTLKNLLTVILCVLLSGALLWYTARRGLVSRGAWKWLGLYGLLIVFQISAEVVRRILALRWLAEHTRDVPAGSVSWNYYFYGLPLQILYDALPFLLLVFIGLLFARKHGGLTFLILLGYLLPTVLFGRYGVWNEAIPFYIVSLAVVIYRFLVALVAPVWLVRAASLPGRQRAAAIPVAIAIACHVFLNLLVSLTWDSQYNLSTDLLGFALYVWDHMIMLGGLGLAIALYLPRWREQAAVPPPPPELVSATE